MITVKIVDIKNFAMIGMCDDIIVVVEHRKLMRTLVDYNQVSMTHDYYHFNNLIAKFCFLFRQYL